MPFEIETLANSLLRNVGDVATYLGKHNLPPPSFKAGQVFDPQSLPADMQAIRCAAISQCQELLDLLQGPSMCLRPCYNATALHAIYKFKIAEKVPVDYEISFQRLAERCKLAEIDVRRIVRFAIAYHRVFEEVREGYVAHSAASLLLINDKDTQDGIGLMFDDFYQSFARTVEAMDTFGSQRPGHTGWALAHGSVTDYDNTFAYLAQNPERATRFGNAMRFFSSTVPGNSPTLLVDGYHWDHLCSRKADIGAVAAGTQRDSAAADVQTTTGTLVDVGGSTGYVSFAIARAEPRLRVVVQDINARGRDSTAAGIGDIAGRQLSTAPDDLRSRVTLEYHDFFTPQPYRGADAFLLRWVLHDWPDTEAIQILRMLIPGLTKGTKVLINDYVAPGKAVGMSPYEERFVRELDMIMLSAFNSYERELHDWKRIVAEADPCFGEIKIVSKGSNSHHTSLFKIMEIEWLGE